MAVISTTDAFIPGVARSAKRIVFTFNGDSALVAAQGAGKTIKVLGMMIGAAADSRFSLDDDAAVIFGPLAVGSDNNVIIPPSQVVLCETADNDALNIALSATDITTGTLWYVVEG
jgi:hypothetical protein